MWNGVICGIDPAYAGRGCGSLNYATCLNSLTRTLQCKTTPVEASRARKVFRRFYNKLWSSKLKKKALMNKIVPNHTQSAAILAISHCKRAVHFHEKNGFQHVADVPFLLNKSNKKSPTFTATVLTLSMESDSVRAKLTEEFQLTSKSSCFNV